MPRDNFRYADNDATAPLKDAFDVSPHDTNELSTLPRALWVGTEGDLEVVLGGETVVLKGASGLIPIRPTIVKAANTDADDIVALY